MLRYVMILLAVLMLATPARAGGFADVSFPNILNALVRFGALNVSRDDIIDEYAMVVACDLYQQYYSDDFQWQKIRSTLRKKIADESIFYPTGFHYDAEMQLDRYDFKTNQFSFKEASAIRNVNSFAIFTTYKSECGKKSGKLLPYKYRAVLDQALYMSGLPLTQADAQALLARLNAAGNKDRIIYTRFNLNIVYVAPLVKLEEKNDLVQSRTDGMDTTVRFDVRLDSQDFYEDKAMTRLIYSYRPNF